MGAKRQIDGNHVMLGLYDDMSLAGIKQRIINQRLKRLLSKGYFPAELPPPFTTESFAENAVKFAAVWDGAKIRSFWTAPEVYSIPRYGDMRRKLSLVNPINQLHVAHLISENWSSIKNKLSRSKVTEFKPEFLSGNAGRAINGIDFDGVARHRVRLLATYGRYVKTDIARFYPSIYTHSIAWSLVGKAFAKANHGTKAFKESFPNHLDKAVGAGQEGQTVGIPIGPDTSRIISELVIVEIEDAAAINIPKFELRSLRYVDDILIGLEENETASAVLSGLSLALYDYQLELNAEKTETFGLGDAHSPEWIHYIRTFVMSDKSERQRGDLDSFFEHSVYLADHNKRDNALLYAVKRAASFTIDESNVPHLVRWMLYSSRRSSTCLSFASEYLSSISSTHNLPSEEIKVYIIQQIPIKAAAGYTDEIAWLLFWAREIGLKIPAVVMDNVMKLRSSVVALLALDIWHKSLIDGALDFSFWQSFACEGGLKSEMWLVSYEATRKGWWPKAQDDQFIKNHPFFSNLLKEGVEFYDGNKHSRKRIAPSAFAKIFEQGDAFGAIDYPM